jgi:uncharacterized membrane protein
VVSDLGNRRNAMRGLMMVILVTTSLLMGLCVVTGAWVLLPFLLVILAVALSIRVKIDKKRLAGERQAFLNLSPEQQYIARRRYAANESWKYYHGNTP